MGIHKVLGPCHLHVESAEEEEEEEEGLVLLSQEWPQWKRERSCQERQAHLV